MESLTLGVSLFSFPDPNSSPRPPGARTLTPPHQQPPSPAQASATVLILQLTTDKDVTSGISTQNPFPWTPQFFPRAFSLIPLAQLGCRHLNIPQRPVASHLLQPHPCIAHHPLPASLGVPSSRPTHSPTPPLKELPCFPCLPTAPAHFL